MTKKNSMTRAEALQNAIALFPSDAPEVEVLDKMIQSITKPRKKSDAPSKARVENEKLAQDMRDAIQRNGSPVNAKWITEHVRGIMTTQKAAAVARVGVELGIINKIVDGRNVSYNVC